MSWWSSLLPRQRWLIVCVALASVLVGAGWLLTRDELDTYTQTASAATAAGLPAVSFGFEYPASEFALRRAGAARRPRSERAYATIDERGGDGVLERRFQVGPFQPGRRDAAEPRTELPILAIPVMRETARTYDGYAMTVEGSATLAGAPGYQFFFKARERVGGGQPQLVFGRVIVVARPPLNQGVAITELATPGPAMRRATDLVVDKRLRPILESFAFGTPDR